MTRHPGTILMIGALACAVGAVAYFAKPEPPAEPAPALRAVWPQPKPAAWEVKAWEESVCDRCKRPITVDPGDGLYIIGGQPYWLHKGCVQAVARAHRR